MSKKPHRTVFSTRLCALTTVDNVAHGQSKCLDQENQSFISRDDDHRRDHDDEGTNKEQCAVAVIGEAPPHGRHSTVKGK